MNDDSEVAAVSRNDFCSAFEEKMKDNQNGRTNTFYSNGKKDAVKLATSKLDIFKRSQMFWIQEFKRATGPLM